MKHEPKILSIETSGNSLSLALSSGNIILAEINFNKRNLHDKLLADYSKRIIEELEMKFDDLSAIAISSGPGSFTGLRIGSALAKGITFDGGIKLIAVPTLRSLAFNAKSYAEMIKKRKIITSVPSHRSLAYLEIYDLDMNIKKEIKLIEKEELLKLIDSDSYFCGTTEFEDESNITSLEIDRKLSSQKIAYLAYEMYLNREFSDSKTFEPFYAQEFEPEKRKKN